MNKLHLSPRFLLTILTLLIIVVAASVAILLAKGYRFSSKKGTILTGTGIMSITSVPDQASVYLDGHLTTATNANINSLTPKTYEVKIVKEGFITWEKKVEVQEGFVSDIKATLFPAIPTIYPLTFNGVTNTLLSADGQKLVFVVPGDDIKKSGIWVWTMTERPIGFARGSEPHKIAAPVSGLDFTKAVLKFSPDSNQVLATLPSASLLLDLDRLNDTPKDVTAILQATLKDWEEQINIKNTARIQTIKSLKIRQTASNSANLSWSPDETRFLYTNEHLSDPTQKISYNVVDLTDGKSYKLPAANSVTWLADSRHLVLVDENENTQTEEKQPVSSEKISVVEFDGNNSSIIYAGTFNTNAVYPWPDGSRLMLITTFPTPTAEKPNLYGINLK